MTLTIIADIHSKPGHEALVLAELKKLVEPTRNEDGCLRYDLHRDETRADRFFFYETWADRARWEQHMNAPHIAAYLAATEGAVNTFEVSRMRRVDGSPISKGGEMP